ncbi:MAG: acylphosphatase [Alphaproteobacteria bacterium]|nr:acylphosphatase [Alphaproteobacteria bacterium]
MPAYRYSVTGRVQGVWFRSWTVSTASGLGLDGWVRNRLDGSVEAVAVGPEDKLEQFRLALHEGPPMAEVTGVAVEPTDPPAITGFHQARTA